MELLEPTNPVLFTEEARSRLLAALYAVINAPGKDNAEPTEEEQKKFSDEQVEKASVAIDKALALKPDYSPARFLRASVAVRLGKTDEALAQLNDLQKANPNDAPLHYERGLLYYRLNNLDEAKKALAEAVKINPKYANAIYFLGLIADRQGNKSEAIARFETVTGLDPNSEEAKTILDNLLAGRAALESISPPGTPPEERTEEPINPGE